VGAAPPIGLPDLVSLTNTEGRQSAKGYPSLGSVFGSSHSRNLRPWNGLDQVMIPDPASASG